MQVIRRKLMPFIGLAVVLGLGPVLANAQATLDEITVTATKREESPQDIPLSIEIVSGEAMENMGITDFTLPTLYRWVRSPLGRECTLHPFRKGFYLGSGPAGDVLREAGLDGEGQYRSILGYLEQVGHRRRRPRPGHRRSRRRAPTITNQV